MSARVLFVTRKFPPSVGGMETLAAGVWDAVRTSTPSAALIAYGGPNRGLVRWLPVTLARTARLLVRRQTDVVLCGDAVVYACLAGLLRLSGVRHATMVMGLDMTYANRVYRAVVHPILRRAPLVIAISSATAGAARSIGVPPERVVVVRPGVAASHVSLAERQRERRWIGERLGVDEDVTVLLTLGRLVRRKGARWFVETVLPELPGNVVYVLAGDGEEAEPIRRAAIRLGLDSRVHLLGRVSAEDRERLMRGADLFVQPNIRVPGDMEGFGLVTVEAALRGTPVVAAALEGILDAVVDGATGVLLPSEEAATWTTQLRTMVADRDALGHLGARFAAAAHEQSSEEAMRSAFIDVLGLRRESPVRG